MPLCWLLVLGSSFATGQELSWYRSFSGTVGKYPVVLNLYKTGHGYSGFYYYTSQQKTLPFYGEDTSLPGNRIRLTVALPNADSSESFSFTISGKIARGEWSAGPGRTLPFSATESSQGPGFDYVYTEGSIKLRPSLPESPAATFEAASIWPKGNNPQAILLKKIIREEFGEKNSTEDIGKIMLQQKKQFFADYLEDNKDVKDEELKDSYSYNQDVSNQLTITYQSPRLIVFSNYNYSYTGGAHGNYGTSYLVVDLVNNKKLGLPDILTAAGRARLPGLLEKYFRIGYELKPTDSLSDGGLFENSIAPNDNFYISAKGIGFSYTPYEIGPYAMGEIEVFIPFSELMGYLQPKFRKLIN